MGRTKKVADATTEVLTKGRFELLIKRSGDKIIGDRGDRVTKSGKIAYKRIVDDLDQQVMTLEDKLDAMLDHSPDNRYSLTVGKQFEADKWSSDYQSLSVQLLNKRVELEVARKNLLDLFAIES